MSTQNPIIVILGPTASGKSGLAVEIAHRNGGEVISADSRQIYRGLDIGTEKITAQEMRGIPHHCIDIASPRRSFSVEQWRKHALRAITHCYRRGVTPILAGGTGMYVDALVFNTSFPAVPPDPTLRKTLALRTPEELFITLTELDPARAMTIEPKNPRRLIRAIEIAHALGQVPPLAPPVPCYDVTWIGINPPFSVLEERIENRLAKAIENGLVRETQMLHETLGISWKRINELGLEYRICAQYLRGELPECDLFITLVREVRRYAKRQMTWLKRYKMVQWHTSVENALADYTARCT